MVGDLCRMMGNFKDEMETEMREPILKAYHHKLTEIGKIDTSVYTFDKLNKDYDRYKEPACFEIVTTINLKESLSFAMHFV